MDPGGWGESTRRIRAAVAWSEMSVVGGGASVRATATGWRVREDDRERSGLLLLPRASREVLLEVEGALRLGSRWGGSRGGSCVIVLGYEVYGIIVMGLNGKCSL